MLLVTIKAIVTATSDANAMDAATSRATATAETLQVHIHPTDRPRQENDVHLAVADTKIHSGKRQHHVVHTVDE